MQHGIACHVEKVTKQAQIIYEVCEDRTCIVHCFTSHKEYGHWYSSYDILSYPDAVEITSIQWCMDALLAAIMKQYPIDTIYTEYFRFSKLPWITVIDPFMR